MRYISLAKLYDSLEENRKRLKKAHLIREFLSKTPQEELEKIILLIQGRVFPLWDKRVLGLSEKLIIKAIGTASGVDEKKIHDEWRNLGDIGRVAEKLIGKKTQSTLFSEDLSIEKVFGNLRKVASSEGKGAVDLKTKLIAQLLSSAEPLEARYIVRNVLGDLRIGVAEGTLRDAIVDAYIATSVRYDEEHNAKVFSESISKEDYKVLVTEVQNALDRSNDFARVATIAQEEGRIGLSKIPITPGIPLKCMLAQKVNNFTEGFDKVGTPCAVEYKMDGFRMQVHKTEEGIKLYTRRLENVTEQFPDVVTYVEKRVKGKTFILDAEAVGYDIETKKYRAFQDISQRIRRKYDIAVLEAKLPVELCVFDILYYEGADFLEQPFEKRRAFLKGVVEEAPEEVVLTKFLKTDNEEEADTFYKQSLAAGNEGIMLKKLDARYQPGSRVGTMIKLKPTLDTLDLVITGAEWGTGKRSGWLTSFSLSCWDDMEQEYLTIGKFGTGIKEKEEGKTEEGAITFDEITELLKPHILSTQGREVEISPELIVEVKFEEIQKSPSYSSGYALRFPRFVKIRDDRGIEDMTTISMVESAYDNQRGR